MQINQIKGFNFSAKIDDSFKKAVQRYYTSEANKRNLQGKEREDYITDNITAFDNRVEEYKNFGTEDMVIKYDSGYKDPSDGKAKHILYVHQTGKPDVVLAGKKYFYKLLERFYNINKHNQRNQQKYGKMEDEVSYIVNKKRQQGSVMA